MGFRGDCADSVMLSLWTDSLLVSVHSVTVYSLKHSIGSVDGADRVREAGRLCDSCRLSMCRVGGPQGRAEMFEGPRAQS